MATKDDFFVATTPIAQNQTSTGTIAMRWFVQHTEYDPANATFRSLVNGEEAFGLVYDAISKANHTIDIICWGFQPSMHFVRSGGNTLSIGALLKQKGEAGVRVRLLCWSDPLNFSSLSENNMPGYGDTAQIKQHMPDYAYKHLSLLSRDYQTSDELKFDQDWYWRAGLNNVTKRSLLTPIAVRAVDAAHSLYYRKEAFKNIDFATRGFSPINRIEIAWHTFWSGKDKDRSLRTKATNSMTMGAIEPTHHQKMVLVDYEDPENAKGFVMGHNMLDQYWDKSDHSCVRQTPTTGRSGPFPWQDMSSWVTGPVLQYLNANFCEAWEDATGENLAKARKGLENRLRIQFDPGGDTPVMAQILRTQSQKGKRDIEKLYLKAANNATQHIFIQNQYFRWVPLANRIRAIAAAHAAGGRDKGKHGPIYLFVITNSGDEAVGTGTVNTYRMLNALGQAKDIPGVASLEQEDVRQDNLNKQMADLTTKQLTANNDLMSAQQLNGMVNTPVTQQKLTDAQQKVDQLNDQWDQLNSEMNSAPLPVMNQDYPGLKVQICTLVAPDSPAGKWAPVYVHAKLMTIDDAFMTLGSANINTRSMEADSELNICHVDGGVTKDLRKKLWTLHAGSKGAQDDLNASFLQWQFLVGKNKDLQNSGNAKPVASIVGFMRTSNARTNSD